MSNPLLQPDGRFKPRTVRDEQGQNRFSEPPGLQQAVPVRADFMTPPPDSGGYQPQYTAATPHRASKILGLGLAGMVLCWLLLLSFTDYAIVGVAASLLGVGLSLAAVVQGYHDLSGMTAGAVDPNGRERTLLGLSFGLAGTFVGLGALVFVLWLALRGIVSLSL
jgi:hypothetical protein